MTAEQAAALREAKFECYLAALSVNHEVLNLGNLTDYRIPIELRYRLRMLRTAFKELDAVRVKYHINGETT